MQYNGLQIKCYNIYFQIHNSFVKTVCQYARVLLFFMKFDGRNVIILPKEGFRMAQTEKKTPLYRSLYQQLKQNIETGVWKTGDLLPGEMQLCEMYHVSRITARQALELLKNEGFITRRAGKGSFITQPPIEQKLNSFYSFSDSSRSSGTPVSSIVLDYEPRKATSFQCELFRIPVRETLIRLERIRLMNGVPFAHETSFFPLRLFPGINREAIEANGLYNSFMQFGGIRPDIAEENFEAVTIGAVSAAHLKVSPQDPAMHITRITRHLDQVVEHCDTIVRGDRIRYNIVMPRTGGM